MYHSYSNTLFSYEKQFRSFVFELLCKDFKAGTMIRVPKLRKFIRVWRVVFLVGFILVVADLKKNRDPMDEVHPVAKGNTVRAFEKYDMRDGRNCSDTCQDEIQKSRLSHLSNACENKLSTEKIVREIDAAFVKSLDHVYVLDQYKLLFCYVPKVACTNWKRIILMLMGELSQTSNVPHLQIHNLAYQKIPTLRKYNVEDAVQRLNNYTKVLFVREPFSRLVSAYRDKLEVPKNSDSKAFRVIYSAKMKGINLKEIGIDYRPEFNVTFYEFISYLSNPVNKLELPGEEHWRTIDELCRPCDLQYDFIGRMETLHRDTDYVIRRFLRKHPKDFQLYDPTNFTNSSSSFVLRDYISEIPNKTLKALTKRFYLDFDAFGYKEQ